MRWCDESRLVFIEFVRAMQMKSFVSTHENRVQNYDNEIERIENRNSHHKLYVYKLI